MKYICFGEVLFDCLPTGPVLGGAPLNVSYHLSQLGNEGWVLSALGEDELGDMARKEMTERGQSLLMVTSVKEPTGRADITLTQGDADYTFNYPCSWDNIPLPTCDLPKEVDLIYFGTLAQRSIKSRETLNVIFERVKAKEVFFDVNIRKDFYSKQLILQGLKRATILKLNEEELPLVLALSGFSCGDYRKDIENLSDYYALGYVIITKGSEGSMVYGKGVWTEVGVEKNLEVVDTVGAGDSLSAGFCHTLLNKGDEKSSLMVGSKIAGFVVTQKGAMPKYPKSLFESLETIIGQ